MLRVRSVHIVRHMSRNENLAISLTLLYSDITFSSDMASRSPSPVPASASASTSMENNAPSSNIQDREDKGDSTQARDTKGSRSRSRSRSFTPPRKGSRSLSRSRSRGALNSRSRSRSFTPRSNRSYSRSHSRSRGRSMTRSMSRSRSPSRDIKRRDTRSLSPVVSLDATVKITRLTMNVKEDHIREIFSPYGKIKYINFPVDPRCKSPMLLFVHLSNFFGS